MGNVGLEPTNLVSQTSMSSSFIYFPIIRSYAQGGTRTLMTSQPTEPKSVVSAKFHHLSIIHINCISRTRT